MDIINLSDMQPNWHWLKDEFSDGAQSKVQSWFHYSSVDSKIAPWLPKRDSAARIIAAIQAIKRSRMSPSVLVSHGPRPTFYGGMAAKIGNQKIPHLAFSFNFTELPVGTLRTLMAKAFRQPTRFVCYSNMERELYAEYFDIPITSIDMIHWAIHTPKDRSIEPAVESGDYVCAIGGQARDYETLFSAMKQLKHIRLVLVATTESIQGLSIPDNATVHTNISLDTTLNILAHSRFMALPLRDSNVPCGHVTLVSGMFYRKGIICTNSKGILDYIRDRETGLLTEAKSVDDWVEKISLLWGDQGNADKLGNRALMFAQEHCTERTAINYFAKFLDDYGVASN